MKMIIKSTGKNISIHFGKNLKPVLMHKYGGHGGMDFVMIYRIIDCLNNGWFLDQDVYDAASWSVVSPLSNLSVELGSVPIKFPDFTRGKANENRKLGVLTNY